MTKTNKKHPKNSFLDDDFRLLIAGESGCGKTNTLMHILRKPLAYYDKNLSLFAQSSSR